MPTFDAPLVPIEAAGRRLEIEFEWVGAAAAPGVPLLVFLHEGLGSLSAWRGWPAEVCEAAGARGLVWSRPGYGRSTPRAAGERWGPDFMHVQAREVLPALLEALAVDAAATPPWLVGHSDGGSIALLHAAAFPARVAGLVVIAPHTHVEPVSLASIRRVREAYRRGGSDGGPKAKLARHHADPDSAFFGWNDAWLAPAFAAWSIEDELASIRCPVLAVQGTADEYGTLAQVRGIAARVPGTRLLELDGCGHSPQRERPAELARAVAAFVHGREVPGSYTPPR
jgi:pimeloyl-ACP methyl ester carboxylesterase